MTMATSTLGNTSKSKEAAYYSVTGITMCILFYIVGNGDLFEPR